MKVIFGYFINFLLGSVPKKEVLFHCFSIVPLSFAHFIFKNIVAAKLQLQTHSAHELLYLYNYPSQDQSEIELLRKQFQSWKVCE